jgi:hypothetical protein
MVTGAGQSVFIFKIIFVGDNIEQNKFSIPAFKVTRLLEIGKKISIAYQSGHCILDCGAMLPRYRHAHLLHLVHALLRRLLHRERLLHSLALLPRYALALLMVHRRAILPAKK